MACREDCSGASRVTCSGKPSKSTTFEDSGGSYTHSHHSGSSQSRESKPTFLGCITGACKWSDYFKSDKLSDFLHIPRGVGIKWGDVPGNRPYDDDMKSSGTRSYSYSYYSQSDEHSSASGGRNKTKRQQNPDEEVKNEKVLATYLAESQTDKPDFEPEEVSGDNLEEPERSMESVSFVKAKAQSGTPTYSASVASGFQSPFIVRQLQASGEPEYMAASAPLAQSAPGPPARGDAPFAAEFRSVSSLSNEFSCVEAMDRVPSYSSQHQQTTQTTLARSYSPSYVDPLGPQFHQEVLSGLQNYDPLSEVVYYPETQQPLQPAVRNDNNPAYAPEFRDQYVPVGLPHDPSDSPHAMHYSPTYASVTEETNFTEVRPPLESTVQNGIPTKYISDADGQYLPQAVQTELVGNYSPKHSHEGNSNFFPVSEQTLPSALTSASQPIQEPGNETAIYQETSSNLDHGFPSTHAPIDGGPYSSPIIQYSQPQNSSPYSRTYVPQNSDHLVITNSGKTTQSEPTHLSIPTNQYTGADNLRPNNVNTFVVQQVEPVYSFQSSRKQSDARQSNTRSNFKPPNEIQHLCAGPRVKSPEQMGQVLHYTREAVPEVSAYPVLSTNRSNLESHRVREEDSRAVLRPAVQLSPQQLSPQEHSNIWTGQSQQFVFPTTVASDENKVTTESRCANAAVGNQHGQQAPTNQLPPTSPKQSSKGRQPVGRTSPECPPTKPEQTFVPLLDWQQTQPRFYSQHSSVLLNPFQQSENPRQQAANQQPNGRQAPIQYSNTNASQQVKVYHGLPIMQTPFHAARGPESRPISNQQQTYQPSTVAQLPNNPAVMNKNPMVRQSPMDQRNQPQLVYRQTGSSQAPFLRVQGHHSSRESSISGDGTPYTNPPHNPVGRQPIINQSSSFNEYDDLSAVEERKIVHFLRRLLQLPRCDATQLGEQQPHYKERINDQVVMMAENVQRRMDLSSHEKLHTPTRDNEKGLATVYEENQDRNVEDFNLTSREWMDTSHKAFGPLDTRVNNVLGKQSNNAKLNKKITYKPGDPSKTERYHTQPSSNTPNANKINVKTKQDETSKNRNSFTLSDSAVNKSATSVSSLNFDNNETSPIRSHISRDNEIYISSDQSVDVTNNGCKRRNVDKGNTNKGNVSAISNNTLKGANNPRPYIYNEERTGSKNNNSQLHVPYVQHDDDASKKPEFEVHAALYDPLKETRHDPSFISYTLGTNSYLNHVVSIDDAFKTPVYALPNMHSHTKKHSSLQLDPLAHVDLTLKANRDSKKEYSLRSDFKYPVSLRSAPPSTPSSECEFSSVCPMTDEERPTSCNSSMLTIHRPHVDGTFVYLPSDSENSNYADEKQQRQWKQRPHSLPATPGQTSPREVRPSRHSFPTNPSKLRLVTPVRILKTHLGTTFSPHHYIIDRPVTITEVNKSPVNRLGSSKPHSRKLPEESVPGKGSKKTEGLARSNKRDKLQRVAAVEDNVDEIKEDTFVATSAAPRQANLERITEFFERQKQETTTESDTGGVSGVNDGRHRSSTARATKTLEQTPAGRDTFKEARISVKEPVKPSPDRQILDGIMQTEIEALEKSTPVVFLTTKIAKLENELRNIEECIKNCVSTTAMSITTVLATDADTDAVIDKPTVSKTAENGGLESEETAITVAERATEAATNAEKVTIEKATSTKPAIASTTTTQTATATESATTTESATSTETAATRVTTTSAVSVLPAKDGQAYAESPSLSDNDPSKTLTGVVLIAPQCTVEAHKTVDSALSDKCGMTYSSIKHESCAVNTGTGPEVRSQGAHLSKPGRKRKHSCMNRLPYDSNVSPSSSIDTTHAVKNLPECYPKVTFYQEKIVAHVSSPKRAKFNSSRSEIKVEKMRGILCSQRNPRNIHDKQVYSLYNIVRDGLHMHVLPNRFQISSVTTMSNKDKPLSIGLDDKWDCSKFNINKLSHNKCLNAEERKIMNEIISLGVEEKSRFPTWDTFMPLFSILPKNDRFKEDSSAESYYGMLHRSSSAFLSSERTQVVSDLELLEMKQLLCECVERLREAKKVDGKPPLEQEAGTNAWTGGPNSMGVFQNPLQIGNNVSPWYRKTKTHARKKSPLDSNVSYTSNLRKELGPELSLYPVTDHIDDGNSPRLQGQTIKNHQWYCRKNKRKFRFKSIMKSIFSIFCPTRSVYRIKGCDTSDSVPRMLVDQSYLNSLTSSRQNVLLPSEPETICYQTSVEEQHVSFEKDITRVGMRHLAPVCFPHISDDFSDEVLNEESFCGIHYHKMLNEKKFTSVNTQMSNVHYSTETTHKPTYTLSTPQHKGIEHAMQDDILNFNSSEALVYRADLKPGRSSKQISNKGKKETVNSSDRTWESKQTDSNETPFNEAYTEENHSHHKRNSKQPKDTERAKGVSEVQRSSFVQGPIVSTEESKPEEISEPPGAGEVQAGTSHHKRMSSFRRRPSDRPNRRSWSRVGMFKKRQRVRENSDQPRKRSSKLLVIFKKKHNAPEENANIQRRRSSKRLSFLRNRDSVRNDNHHPEHRSSQLFSVFKHRHSIPDESGSTDQKKSSNISGVFRKRKSMINDNNEDKQSRHSKRPSLFSKSRYDDSGNVEGKRFTRMSSVFRFKQDTPNDNVNDERTSFPKRYSMFKNRTSLHEESNDLGHRKSKRLSVFRNKNNTPDESDGANRRSSARRSFLRTRSVIPSDDDNAERRTTVNMYNYFTRMNNKVNEEPAVRREGLPHRSVLRPRKCSNVQEAKQQGSESTTPAETLDPQEAAMSADVTEMKDEDGIHPRSSVRFSTVDNSSPFNRSSLIEKPNYYHHSRVYPVKTKSGRALLHRPFRNKVKKAESDSTPAQKTLSQRFKTLRHSTRADRKKSHLNQTERKESSPIEGTPQEQQEVPRQIRGKGKSNICKLCRHYFCGCFLH